MIYFTSDWHFLDFHLLNAIDFSPKRSVFPRVFEMDETIIENFNKVVSKTDTTYFLGDTAVYFEHDAQEKIFELVNRLNGKIIFIKGNHDSSKLFKYFEQQDSEKYSFNNIGEYLKAEHFQFFITHYPMIFGVPDNKINLHGHIHNASVMSANNINVGIDSKDFEYLNKPIPFGQPLSFKQILTIYRNKKEVLSKNK